MSDKPKPKPNPKPKPKPNPKPKPKLPPSLPPSEFFEGSKPPKPKSPSKRGGQKIKPK